MAQRVFLSYGREDDEPFVKQVHEYLTAQGIFAWYDRENLPSRGEAFTAEIARAIESSDRMLLFIGDYAAKSEWCKREWLHALKNCVPITPILVHHTFATVSDTIKRTYPSDVLQSPGLACTPDQRADAEAKIHKLITNAEILPLASLNNVPIKVNAYMERPQYTQAIKNALRIADPTNPHDARSSTVGITTATGVQGIAGIGKTTLASAIAHECDVRRHFDLILWLTVGYGKGRSDAPNLLFNLALQLNPSEISLAEQYKDENIARMRLQHLLSNRRTLLILDDVWDKTLLEAFQFSIQYFKLMVTTRHANLLSENMVAVDSLSDAEGVKLIAYYQNSAAPDETSLPAECLAIVQTLKGHTLAIKIIASLLSVQGLHEAPEYGKRLKDLAHENLFAYLEEEKLSDTDETKRNLSVELSFSLSYKSLQGSTQKHLRALGVFAPNSTFDIQALQAVWEIEDHLLAKKAANALEAVGLLEYIGDDRYSQHTLIRAYALQLLKEAGEWEIAFGNYANYYIQVAEQFSTLPPEAWKHLDDDLVHIHHTGSILVREIESNSDFISLASKFAFSVSNYVVKRPESEGTPYLMMGYKISLMTNDIERIAYYGHYLAQYFMAMGNLETAEYLLLESLRLINNFGNDVGKVAILQTLSVLSQIKQDDLSSQRYIEQAIKISHEIDYAQGLASGYINLARLVFHNQDMDKAEDYIQKAEKYIDQNDLSRYASILMTKAGIFTKRGDFDKALDVYDKALKLKKDVGDKFSIASIFINKAVVLKNIHDSSKAQLLVLEAIDIFKEAKNVYELFKAYYWLALIEYDRTNINDAIKWIDICISMTQSVQDLNVEMLNIKKNRLVDIKNGEIPQPTKELFDSVESILQTVLSLVSTQGHKKALSFIEVLRQEASELIDPYSEQFFLCLLDVLTNKETQLPNHHPYHPYLAKLLKEIKKH